MPAARKSAPTTDKKTIVYDGLCVMCKDLTKTIDHSAKKSAFAKVDFTRQSVPEGVDRAAAEKGIHVVASDGVVYRNAAAILQIIEEYPRWAWAARVGRLPGIRTFLELAYRLVAANRHHIWGPAKRLYWTKVIVSLGLLAGLFLSVPLWLSSNTALSAPVFGWWPQLGSPFDVIALIVAGGALLAILLSPRPARAIGVCLGMFALLGLGNQLRWQPWVYQYLAMVAILLGYSWRRDDRKGYVPSLNTSRLIIASIYLWSGVHKLNPGFVYDMYPWLVHPLTNLLPHSMGAVVTALGVFVPVFEMAIGVGLVLPALRRWAVWAAVGMHGAILLFLGPLGWGWNSVVWPWNAAMLALVLVLFWRTPTVRLGNIIWNDWPRRRVYHAVILVLFGILPVLSLSGRWDAYLSSALYSNDIPRATIRTNRATLARLPQPIPPSAIHAQSSTVVDISVSQWVFEAYNVPPYPEPRIYKQLATELCRYADRPQDVRLNIRFDHMSYRTERLEEYQCAPSFSSLQKL